MLLEIRKQGIRNSWCLLILIPVVTAGLACLNNPCIHGICIDDINSTYSCYCTDGYTGVQCQTNWDECWSNPCQNGGTCIDGVATYNCTCAEGFIGDNCETNYNECDSNPCFNNGTCIDMTNDYVCHCLPGFSGEHCQNDVAVCNATEEIRCYNGGECVEGPGYRFFCRCLPGWTGPKCEDQIDECESNPCQNGGICIDAHADYMCACTYGFTGKSCETQIEFCDENSCSNGALCVVEDGEQICYCVPDFHGEHCELQYDECLLGPRCMNGGTCIDGVDNFTCSCPPRLTGSLCECLILDDNSYDCDYVNPTRFPITTEIALTTLLTDSPNISSITETSYNTTTTSVFSSIPVLDFTTLRVTTDSETKGTSSTLPDVISTTEKGGFRETLSTTSTTIQEDTTVSKLDTTTEILVLTKQTQSIDSDNSKTETTTDCNGICGNTTMKISTIADFETTQDKFKTTEPTVYTEKTMTDQQTTLTVTTESTEALITTQKTSSTISAEGRDMDSTTKQDITTEKLFTNIPYDHITTESTLTDGTTEEYEISTVTDSTQLYPTEYPECTLNVCKNRGTCFNGPQGIRCHCTFNYSGRYCEEPILITSAAFSGNSYIVHHIKNSTSLNIEFNAKTLITDGELMHVDIAKGVYMELFMNMGLLKFKFSCGYQTMLLSELKTFVNKGFPMKIETRLDLYSKEQHCNATLRLNDTVAMSGGQIANITILNDNSTLVFGNAHANASEHMPFVGCIKDLIVNGEKRSVFGDALDAGEITECSSLGCLSGPCLNGGICKEHGEGYHCLCANGWMGVNCNHSVCDNNPCQYGGSCVRHPGSGFLCMCPYGKHGIFCEYNVEIARAALAPITIGKSAYIIYPLSSQAMNSDRFDLRLKFQTEDMDQIALLAFIGQNGRHDSKSQHLALTFVKRYIMLTWNMGGGSRRIFTSRALSPRRGGHTVRVWRRGRTAGLSVDGRYNVSGNAPAHDTKMNVLPYIFIGGHPSEHFRDLPHDLPLHSGWRGCVWEVAGPAVRAGAGGRGAGQCGVAHCTPSSCHAPHGVCIHSPATYGCICNDGWFGSTCASRQSQCDFSGQTCHGRCVVTAHEPECDCPYGTNGTYCENELFPVDILFTGKRSYLKLHPRAISSVTLALEAEIKPTKERGLIAYVETPHFYTALSLQGGLLEYRWTDRLSGLTSLVRSSIVLSMTQWHAVRAGRYGSRLYVWVDGALTTEPMVAHAYPHTASEASIVLGGAEDLATLPFDVMLGPPESYKGCLRNFHVNNILLALEPQNIAAGQNIDSCGTCAGCRGRRATCSPGSCASGRCRARRCVCPAGRAGERCEREITVTIPQFDGDAMLSLTRPPSGRTEQLTLPAAPGYIAFNFTTAEPSGLLLWMNMGINYVGLGLENGYLKLALSLHCNDEEANYSNTPKALSQIIQSGFMADGDWHSVVFKLGPKIYLNVDGETYVDETCSNDHEFVEVDTFIGGVTEDIYEVRKIFPENFRGCIDHISTKQETYTNFTHVYSENILMCQPFPST
ncbi:unnamed protein product [Colias eurytheme]|nr:unnamed protein product [Colias eurytheme]